MAKRNTTAIQRPRKKSDSTYNARRRYAREAERNLKKAEQSTGATSSRYRRLAQESYKKALQTYTDTGQKAAGRIQRLGERLGVDYQTRREAYREQKQDLGKLERESFEFTETGRKQLGKILREREAETIMNSPIGKRVIAGLEGIWREPATDLSGKVDKAKIYPAIMDYFNVDNLANLLERIEAELGEVLYTDQGGELENYDVVKLQIQVAYKSGAFVA